MSSNYFDETLRAVQLRLKHIKCSYRYAAYWTSLHYLEETQEVQEITDTSRCASIAGKTKTQVRFPLDNGILHEFLWVWWYVALFTILQDNKLPACIAIIHTIAALSKTMTASSQHTLKFQNIEWLHLIALNPFQSIYFCRIITFLQWKCSIFTVGMSTSGRQLSSYVRQKRENNIISKQKTVILREQNRRLKLKNLG